MKRTSRTRPRQPKDGRRATSSTPFDVLVLDAGSRQSLAAIRSLGRAGLRVAAAECFVECSPELPVLGFRSRWSEHCEVLPSYADDPEAYGDAVLDFLRRHPTPVVLPGADGTITALRPRRAELARLGAQLALPTERALAVANDKDRTLELAETLGLRTPTTLRIATEDDLAGVFARLAFPLVLKPTVSWVEGATVRLQAVEVLDAVEATWVARELLESGGEVLAQELLTGRREGVTVMRANGQVRATFAHVEHRTSPALGGASVLRESIPVPPDLDEATTRLVDALDLDGLSEVEFRRDASGVPQLMEINARLAGPTEIAMVCGMDFPLMLWRWVSTLDVGPVGSYRTGVRMRWLRGDLRWLRDNARRVGRPDSVSVLRSVAMFVGEFVRTRHYDCLHPRDLAPALAEAQALVAAVRDARRPSKTPPRLFNAERTETEATASVPPA